MAVIRIYGKDGSLKSPALTTPMPQGGLCHVEGDQFASADSLGVYLIRVTPGGVTQDRKLVTLTGPGAVQTGSAVDIASNRGGKLVVTMRHDTGGVRQLYVRGYDIETGTQDLNASLGPSANEGGIAFNGTLWWVSYESTAFGNPDRITQLDISGPSVSVTRDTALSLASPATTFFASLTWDGIDLWALVGSSVGQWEIPGRQAPSRQQSWTAAGGVHKGIATDGQNIYILSRT